MPTDSHSPLILDQITSKELLFQQLEKREGAVLFFEAALENWDWVREILLQLRASNRSAILTVKRPEVPLDKEECEFVFQFLHHWDQLFLQNILNLLGQVIPESYSKLLQAEVRIELMWFREWFSASQDERLSKYPGLPWRSYIRRIINENYQFARQLMDYAFHPPEENKELVLAEILKTFLVARKKAVCLFPKKWGQKTA